MRHFFFFGDEAKSKICAALAKSGKYSHILRFNGSSNAGHTWFFGQKKIVSHIIPTGIPYGLVGIIGPGCALNISDFFKELEELEQLSPGCSDRVKIAYNTHIVTDAHRNEELAENRLGTTKKGVGPAYRDKYARVGLRAESVPELKNFLIDVREELNANSNISVLAEGAQAYGLDIDWGDYPYVTSSHCGLGGLINNGISYKCLRNIYGAAKAYTTYVGSKKFQNANDPVLNDIGDIGQEYGATTGRRRQVNYLDLNMLESHSRYLDLTHLVVSKMDVLKTLNCWKVIRNGRIIDLETEERFKNTVIATCPQLTEIKFSYTPMDI